MNNQSIKEMVQRNLAVMAEEMDAWMATHVEAHIVLKDAKIHQVN